MVYNNIILCLYTLTLYEIDELLKDILMMNVKLYFKLQNLNSKIVIEF